VLSARDGNRQLWAMGLIAQSMDVSPPAKRRAPGSWQILRRRERCVLRQAFRIWYGNWTTEAFRRQWRFGYQSNWGGADSGCSMCSDGTCPYCCDDCHGCQGRRRPSSTGCSWVTSTEIRTRQPAEGYLLLLWQKRLLNRPG